MKVQVQAHPLLNRKDILVRKARKKLEQRKASLQFPLMKITVLILIPTFPPIIQDLEHSSKQQKANVLEALEAQHPSEEIQRDEQNIESTKTELQALDEIKNHQNHGS